ncbi:MAG: hypothetical protein A3J83_03135 [Elusimicrobia bacterium RIFOXYA2_FULL_40_6]|nr:MAG: hypothetical protein A3J83_03135 [Elusimicrobia bacterium RIFOXYA2_FULL_40_6]
MKRFLLSVCFMSVFAAGVFAQEASTFRVSLLNVPSDKIVNGVDIGLLATSCKEVRGAQLGSFYAGVSDKIIGHQNALVTNGNIVEGYQDGFINIGKDVSGHQYGFINIAGRMNGVQTCFLNVSSEVNGMQIGVLNITQKMHGIQIGLLNIISKGPLPAMVLFNASF